jgi:hypothetical protein
LLHQDGVGTLFLAIFDGIPSIGEGSCEVARVALTDVDISSEDWTHEYTVSGIPTRDEPYFVVALFDDNGDLDPTGRLRPGEKDLVDLRGEALTWPSAVIKDSDPVLIDLNLNFVQGR